METESVQLHIIPTRSPAPHYSELYFAAYACWTGVWPQTYRELTQKQNMASDAFTRQDEIMALFRGNKCLGMVFMRYESFSDPAVWHDSYFAAWPAFAIHRLLRHGPNLAIVSQMTGAQDERGKPIEGKMKIQELLMALSSLRFLEMGADVMVGTPRLAVGMGNSCSKAGATRILMGLQMHGVDVECLEFTRPNVLSLELPELVQRKWAERVHHSRSEQKRTHLHSAA
ncbi:MAG: hypothetical protein AABZ31_03740 [Bdellovibrionota bacterium]